MGTRLRLWVIFLFTTLSHNLKFKTGESRLDGLMMSTEKFLSGVHAVILGSGYGGLGKVRARILSRLLKKYRGEVLSNVSTAATHILVGGKNLGKNIRRSCLRGPLGCEIPSGVGVLHGDWLSHCMMEGERVSEGEYEVPLDSASSSPCSKEDIKEAPLATNRSCEEEAPATERIESEGGEERRGEQEKCESVQKREETLDGYANFLQIVCPGHVTGSCMLHFLCISTPYFIQMSLYLMADEFSLVIWCTDTSSYPARELQPSPHGPECHESSTPTTHLAQHVNCSPVHMARSVTSPVHRQPILPST